MAEPAHPALAAAAAYSARSGERYRIAGDLGRPGGFAAVHLAHDGHGAAHALKRLRLAGLPARLLTDEADRLRRVRHANVVALHDTGDEPAAFLVMELAPDGSLREVIGAARRSGRPLALAELLDLGMQVMRALVAVHAQELLHCDVKASNVLLAGATAKLADFGSALPHGGGATLGRFGQTAAASRPPEAWLDGERCRPGPAYDLYGAGVLLYELATLRPPFLAADPAALRRQHLLLTAPPPSQLRPGLPTAFDALVRELLQKDPARRPASARAALERLQPLTIARRNGA